MRVHLNPANAHKSERPKQAAQAAAQLPTPCPGLLSAKLIRALFSTFSVQMSNQKEVRRTQLKAPYKFSLQVEG
jgi:hypothetical protein